MFELEKLPRFGRMVKRLAKHMNVEDGMDTWKNSTGRKSSWFKKAKSDVKNEVKNDDENDDEKDVENDVKNDEKNKHE